ncbi:MAG: 4-phosphoerythronate dehydrogenase [Bacteroidales bacterium]|nr:4-phosphoerythronate dehydrogenase [Bacteroidales bacterium]
MKGKLKIVVDDMIPFIEGVFEPYAEVVYMAGEEISREDVIDADALILRTRTRCDASLLDGTAVRFIASAAIGTDHIDFDYCNSHGIVVRNAIGCNAGGVMNYVFSALYGCASRKAIPLEGKTMGIIGVGNVGKRVERMANYLGFKVLRNDPPRAEAEGRDGFCDLDTLLESSDIITLHVPLDASTRDMADASFFSKMRDGAFLINTCRGEVIVEEDLIAARPHLGPVIIDTWRHEPRINRELMDVTDIATPHIAGYSYAGKQNGTAMAVRAVARFYGLEHLYEFFPATEVIEEESVKLDLRGKKQGEIASLIQYNYPIFTDDFFFRINPDDFVRLRSEYQYRKEYYVDY